jgi:hypothetical protein
MNLKLLSAVTIFATATTVVFAQKDDHAPKPTLAEAQNVVQTISNDKAKLQAYCELGKLEDQMEKAEEANDTKTVESSLREERRARTTNRLRVFEDRRWVGRGRPNIS